MIGPVILLPVLPGLLTLVAKLLHFNAVWIRILFPILLRLWKERILAAQNAANDMRLWCANRLRELEKALLQFFRVCFFRKKAQTRYCENMVSVLFIGCKLI